MRLFRAGLTTVKVGLCEHCRATEAAHARAAVVILEDNGATEDERQIAADELAHAARWLGLPDGSPRGRSNRRRTP